MEVAKLRQNIYVIFFHAPTVQICVTEYGCIFMYNSHTSVFSVYFLKTLFLLPTSLYF